MTGVFLREAEQRKQYVRVKKIKSKSPKAKKTSTITISNQTNGNDFGNYNIFLRWNTVIRLKRSSKYCAHHSSDLFDLCLLEV